MKNICGTIVLLLAFGFSCTAMGKANLLINGSFEGGGLASSAGALPPEPYGWQNTSMSNGKRGCTSGRREQRGNDGRYTLYIEDESTTCGEAWRSMLIAVTEGVAYTLRGEVYRLKGYAPFFYVSYFDDAGTEIESSLRDTGGNLGKWDSAALITTAPLGAVNAQVKVYSLSNRKTSCFFDNLEFTRSDNQRFVDNSNFEVDPYPLAPAKYFPRRWTSWESDNGYVYLSKDPKDDGNVTLQIKDDSEDYSGSAKTVFDISPGIIYTVSTDVFLVGDSDQARVYLKFRDEDGNEVASQNSDSTDTKGQWQNGAPGHDLPVTATALAPANARTAEVILYCTASNKCNAYFDNVMVVEAFSDVRYVGPKKMGNGSGKDAKNAAYYNNKAFWYPDDDSSTTTVQEALATHPVKVVFLEGTYVLKNNDHLFELKEMGDPENRLVLEAERVYGTVFKIIADPKTDSQATSSLFRIKDCTNLSVRNIRFTSDYDYFEGGLCTDNKGNPLKECLYYNIKNKKNLTSNVIAIIDNVDNVCDKNGFVGFKEARSNDGQNIYIEDIAITDMPRVVYGGVNIVAKVGPNTTVDPNYIMGTLNNTRVIRGEFIRAGHDHGYHHIYAAKNLKNLVVEGGYFEDSSGPYVKLRSNLVGTHVSRSHFYSTGTYPSYGVRGDQKFVQFAVYPLIKSDDFNDRTACKFDRKRIVAFGIETPEPKGDEWFGYGYQIDHNDFSFRNNSSSPNGRIPFVITHNGFNPLDHAGTERHHLDLLDIHKSEMMDTTVKNVQTRRNYMEKTLHLIANNCDAGICFSDNKFTNVSVNTATGKEYYVVMWISDDMGRDPGKKKSNLTADVSNLFTQ